MYITNFFLPSYISISFILYLKHVLKEKSIGFSKNVIFLGKTPKRDLKINIFKLRAMGKLSILKIEFG